MKRLLQIIFCIFGINIALSCFASYSSQNNQLNIRTQKDMITYHVELAVTPQEQRKGLMHRQTLPDKHGMLFLFHAPRVARMWMKNTLIPLDMIFFDEKGIVTSVHHNARPEDTAIISSMQPVAGVLEINATEAQQYSIEQGSVLDLQPFK